MKTIEKADKKTIQQWAKDYHLVALSELFDEFQGKVASAIVKDFGDFVASEGIEEDIYVWPSISSDGQPLIDAHFGHADSNVTPHTIRQTLTVEEFTEDIIDHFTNPYHHLGDHEALSAWRDALRRAADSIDHAIQNTRHEAI